MGFKTIHYTDNRGGGGYTHTSFIYGEYIHRSTMHGRTVNRAGYIFNTVCCIARALLEEVRQQRECNQWNTVGALSVL